MITNPSKYQTAIRDHIFDSRRHLVVKAAPGSGKSTTTEWCIEQVPHNKSVLYLAFNRHIVDSFKKRSPREGTWVATTHSFGLSNLRKIRKKGVTPDDGKAGRIAKDILGDSARDRASTLVTLLKFARITLTNVESRLALEAMIDTFNLDLAECDWDLLDMLPEALKMSNDLFDKTGLVDFEDMLYLPVIRDSVIYKFDYVFVDEGQDYSNSQIAQALSSVKSNGKVVAVGDPRQSINMFAGSAPDSFEQFKDRLSAEELPLSISYRCPKKVVQEAQKLYPDIEAKEDAKDGLVESLDKEDLVGFSKPEDMIISRFNAPIVSFAYQFIGKGVKASVRGREIGKNLASFAKRFSKGGADFEEFHARLDEYQAKEFRRLSRRDGQESKIQALDDKCEVIRVVADRVAAPEEIQEEFDKIFSDEQGSGVKLSSIHRAKGLEAERVFIIDPGSLPLKQKNPADQAQEKNIKFVALTRSKNEMYLVEKKDKPKKEALPTVISKPKEVQSYTCPECLENFTDRMLESYQFEDNDDFLNCPNCGIGQHKDNWAIAD